MFSVGLSKENKSYVRLGGFHSLHIFSHRNFYLDITSQFITREGCHTSCCNHCHLQEANFFKFLLMTHKMFPVTENKENKGKKKLNYSLWICLFSSGRSEDDHGEQ